MVGVGVGLVSGGLSEHIPQAGIYAATATPRHRRRRRANPDRQTHSLCNRQSPELRACPGWIAPRLRLLDRNEKWKKWVMRRMGPDQGQTGRHHRLGEFPVPLATPVAAPPEMAPPAHPARGSNPATAAGKSAENGQPARGAKPPAVEKPPAKPAEAPTPGEKKPEEAKPAKPAKPVKPETAPPEEEARLRKPLKPAKPVKPKSRPRRKKNPRPGETAGETTCGTCSGEACQDPDYVGAEASGQWSEVSSQITLQRLLKTRRFPGQQVKM